MTFDKNKIVEELKKERSYDLVVDKECGVLIFGHSSLYTGEYRYKLKIYKKIEGVGFRTVIESEDFKDIEKLFTTLEVLFGIEFN